MVKWKELSLRVRYSVLGVGVATTLVALAAGLQPAGLLILPGTITSNLCAPGVCAASSGPGGTQPANTVYAGPPTGAAAIPSFRVLQPIDIPILQDTGIQLSTSLDGYTYQSAWNAYVQSLITETTCNTPLTCPTGTDSGTGHQTITFSLTGPVVINTNASSAPTAPTTNAYQYVCADTLTCTDDIDDFAASRRVLGRRWDGTNASPSAVGAAEPGIGIAARFYDGSSMPTSDEAYIWLITSQAQTSSHHGTGMDFYTTPNNTTSAQHQARMDASGGIEMYSAGSAPTGGDEGGGTINLAKGAWINGAPYPGTPGTTFTVSGCGTAGSVTGGAAAGSFTIGTGASSCTFTITINGATGAAAAHGWVVHAVDATKAITCTDSTTVSTTTVVFVCGGTPATSDLVKFFAVPY